MALRIVQIGGSSGQANLDHNLLSNRAAADQHTVEAITGLKTELDDIKLVNDEQGTSITNIDGTVTDVQLQQIEDTDLLTNRIDTTDSRVNNVINDVAEYRRDDVNKVNTYNDMIALVSPFDSMLVLVKEVPRKLYSYNIGTGIWDPVSSGGTGLGSITPLYEVHIATEDQALFTLNSEFIPNTNGLEVYIDGALVNGIRFDNDGIAITNFDYIEESTTEVRFQYDLLEGQLVTFRTPNRLAERKIFVVNNNSDITCTHNLNTRYVHISVYANNVELNNCVKQVLDENRIKVINTTPFNGVVVIS